MYGSLGQSVCDSLSWWAKILGWLTAACGNIAHYLGSVIYLAGPNFNSWFLEQLEHQLFGRRKPNLMPKVEIPG